MEIIKIKPRKSKKPKKIRSNKKVSFKKGHKVYKIPNEHYKTPKNPLKI